jgi:uncharacterized protein (TIGR04255 family)
VPSTGEGRSSSEDRGVNAGRELPGRTVDFERPPVTETILGVQFVPLHGFTLPYMGLYWGEVRDRYPGQEVKPPLPPVMEDLSSAPQEARIGISLSSEPDARCWLIDETSTQLIQVQRDRFIRNWRKGQPPYDSYPRYTTLRPEFERDWTLFGQFLEREGLGVPEINQCEVTYINHIELGAGWDSIGDAHRVLAILNSHDHQTFLPAPEMVTMNVRYLMPARRGRLHVATQPVVRRADGRQVLQLALTARGKPDSSRLEDVVAWFDQGHEWIVRGFVDLTTPAMHAIWGRRL